jgi:hypothetical protein
MSEHHTITLTPVVNESAVRAYAEKYQCRNPWDHVAGRLLALDAMSMLLGEAEEKFSVDMADMDEGMTILGIFRRMRQLHSAAGQEMHGLFGEAAEKEDV